MTEILLASDTRAWFQDVLVYGLCVIAILWGAGPERAAIAIWWTCLELPDLAYRYVLGMDVLLTGVDGYLAAKDLAAGLLWIVLALYANRNYTLWIAGTQLLAMGSHVARGLVESISPIAYIFMVVAPGWIQLALMVVGFSRHILRRRKYGVYRDWRVIKKPLDFEALAQGTGLSSAVEVERTAKQENEQ